ncbi:MAG: hypothetical protein ACRD3J_31425 [Thermoanaerobaculia bacterium]
MNVRDQFPFEETKPDIEVWSLSIPLRERLLDRMGDLLFCADDLLAMLSSEENQHRFEQWERPLQSAYDSINSLMKSLCD